MLTVLLDNGCKADHVFKGYSVQTSALVLSAIRNSFKCLEILLENGAKDEASHGYTAYTWAKILGWTESLKILQNNEKICIGERTFEASNAVMLGQTGSDITTHTQNDNSEETVSSKNCNGSEENVSSKNCDGSEETVSSKNCNGSEENVSSKDCNGNEEFVSSGEYTTLRAQYKQQHLPSPIIFIWRFVQWMDISDTLERLIEQGHDVNTQDQYGRTSLHLAVEEQSRSGLRTLLQIGADPELKDSCGATPFWHAVYWNKRSMIQELLFANVTMEIKARKDAIKLGVPWHNLQPISHNTEKHYKTPIYFAVKRNWILTVSLLLEAGYNLNNENIKELLKHSKDEMRSLLFQHMQQPKSLLDLSRNFVRRHCGLKIHKMLEGLDVPARIKDCLLLRDIVDLKIEPVLVHL